MARQRGRDVWARGLSGWWVVGDGWMVGSSIEQCCGGLDRFAETAETAGCGGAASCGLLAWLSGLTHRQRGDETRPIQHPAPGALADTALRPRRPPRPSIVPGAYGTRGIVCQRWPPFCGCVQRVCLLAPVSSARSRRNCAAVHVHRASCMCIVHPAQSPWHSAQHSHPDTQIRFAPRPLAQGR